MTVIVIQVTTGKTFVYMYMLSATGLSALDLIIDRLRYS